MEHSYYRVSLVFLCAQGTRSLRRSSIVEWLVNPLILPPVSGSVPCGLDFRRVLSLLGQLMQHLARSWCA